jgi:membrane peptidoglycan carboxypeptidase
MIKKHIGLIFASVCLIFTVLALCILSSVPDLDLDKITNVTESLTVYDKYSAEATVINSGQNREKISFDKIPAQVINALIATEDVRFFQHNGVDIKRIFGALIEDVKSGSLKQGASTLTQQLIKNSHLTSEKTFMRKASEAVLALQLERKFSKEQILEAYLNFVYFGRGAYGIQAAAVSYFDKNASDLTLDEGAMLIGILKAPSKYAPHISYQKAVDRRNTVLGQMKKYGFITESEYAQAKSASTEISKEKSYFDYGFYLDAVLEEGAELLKISVFARGARCLAKLVNAASFNNSSIVGVGAAREENFFAIKSRRV